MQEFNPLQIVFETSPTPPTRSEHTTDPETSEPQTTHPPGPNHGLCSESLTQVLNVLPPSPSHCPTACFTGTSSLWNNRDRHISSLPSLTGDLQLYDSAATPEVNATYPIRLYLGGAVVPFSSFGFGNQDTTAVHSPVNADDAWIIRPRSAVAVKCPDPAVRPIRLDDNTWSCHSTPSVIITSTVISTPPDVLGLDDDVWSCHSTPFLETTSIFFSSESSKSSPPSPVQITLTRRVGDLTHSFHPTYPPSRSTWQEAILAANLTVVGISLRGVFGLQLWGGLLGALRGMPRLQRLLIDDMVRPQARIVRATTASCSQFSQDVRDQFLCDFIPSDLEGFNGSGPSGGKRIEHRVTGTSGGIRIL
ncbi:hypothetical protein PHLCEN_2v4586 [Hermanssonia centrifuga]|uniref:Uncharacterized protein n=1 Tax=Hermanssonia centrifuga TaxID=98765 RepID=A0A2R6PN52_9APHY|nr:hypothetical protein PHLCEN_2v4586 [Hermanssonia centrifuga]